MKLMVSRGVVCTASFFQLQVILFTISLWHQWRSIFSFHMAFFILFFCEKKISFIRSERRERSRPKVVMLLKKMYNKNHPPVPAEKGRGRKISNAPLKLKKRLFSRNFSEFFPQNPPKLRWWRAIETCKCLGQTSTILRKLSEDVSKLTSPILIFTCSNWIYT